MADNGDSAADVYEDDMRFVVSVIDWLNRHCPDDDRYISAGRITIDSRQGYTLGDLVLDDGSEKWRFVPHVASAGAGSGGV